MLFPAEKQRGSEDFVMELHRARNMDGDFEESGSTHVDMEVPVHSKKGFEV